MKARFTKRHKVLSSKFSFRGNPSIGMSGHHEYAPLWFKDGIADGSSVLAGVTDLSTHVLNIVGVFFELDCHQVRKPNRF